MRIIHYLGKLGVINNKWGEGSKIEKKISPEKILSSCLVNATRDKPAMGNYGYIKWLHFVN